MVSGWNHKPYQLSLAVSLVFDPANFVFQRKIVRNGKRSVDKNRHVFKGMCA